MDPLTHFYETPTQRYNRRLHGLRNQKRLFRAIADISPVDGRMGLFAGPGGIPVQRVLEFTSGELMWTFSDACFYSLGFGINFGDRTYMQVHRMDALVRDARGVYIPCADLVNSALHTHQRLGTLHPNYRRPTGATDDQMTELYFQPNAHIGAIADEHRLRVFVETTRPVPENMEILSLYSLHHNCYEDFPFVDGRPRSFAELNFPEQGALLARQVLQGSWSWRDVGIFCIDVIRHDMDKLLDPDASYHSLFITKFQHATTMHIIPTEGLRAFYTLRQVQEDWDVWVVVQSYEVEIWAWVRQHNILQNRVVDPAARLPIPFGRNFWLALATVDSRNYDEGHPTYVNSIVGEVRGRSELAQPYGATRLDTVPTRFL